MIRCYAEKSKDGMIDHLIIQDETGVFYYEPGGKVEFVPRNLLSQAFIKFPGKADQTVMTNTREFLEFVRLCERNSYMTTIPTEIREYEGTKEEAAKKAWYDFGQGGHV